jgi:tRNA (cmo5U34)-methyltransferase
VGLVTVSAWKRDEVAAAYLDRRRAIPLWREQGDVMRTLLTRAPRRVERFLDLGTGDGYLAELVLDACDGSRAELVDFSQPMLDAAAARLERSPDRWHAVEADLSTPAWLDALPAGGYDAVVSSFCIHHLDHERKRALYRELLELLNPGGLFLNWEHVETAPLGTGLFDHAMVQGLSRLQPGRSPDEVAREYRERPDALENKLLDVRTQCAWLREAGFEGVDVFFKWIELAIFGGTKKGAV